ncbi:MAG: hypothetical protein ACXABO_16260 [Promethearchaeota archaeon]|jgi:hypothetical protein
MIKKKIISLNEFWEQADKLNLKRFISSILDAAKSQIAHSKALNLSRKAKILLRNNSAGQKYDNEAEMHYRRRNTQLLNAKERLTNFMDNSDEELKNRFNEFIDQGHYEGFLTDNKQLTILRLLHSDCVSPEDSRNALEQLDQKFENLGKLKSLEDIHLYVGSHIDEIIEKRKGNDLPYGICIILLLVTSILILLIIVAAMICAFTFGLICDLNLLIDNACGGS